MKALDTTFDALFHALTIAERNGARVTMSRPAPRSLAASVRDGASSVVALLSADGLEIRGDGVLRRRLGRAVLGHMAAIDAGTDEAPVRAVVWTAGVRIDWDAAGRLPLETLRYVRMCERIRGERRAVAERLDNLIAWRAPR